MSNTVVHVKPSNGVSFACRYTITAADALANGITFDFGKVGGVFRFGLAPIVQIFTAAGLPVITAGYAVATSEGKVSVTGTAESSDILEGRVISLVAGRDVLAVDAVSGLDIEQTF